MFQPNELVQYHNKETNTSMYAIFLKEGGPTWSFIKTASTSSYIKTYELKPTGYIVKEKE